MSKYLSYDWMKIYDHYIKAGGELSNQLQLVLDMMEGKKNNGDLKDWFFSIINNLGVNHPEVMEIDMSIDFFGWHRTLQLIIDIADMYSLETVSTSVETVSCPTHVEEPEAADLAHLKSRVVDISLPRRRRRPALEQSIKRYSNFLQIRVG